MAIQNCNEELREWRNKASEIVHSHIMRVIQLIDEVLELSDPSDLEESTARFNLSLEELTMVESEQGYDNDGFRELLNVIREVREEKVTNMEKMLSALQKQEEIDNDDDTDSATPSTQSQSFMSIINNKLDLVPFNVQSSHSDSDLTKLPELLDKHKLGTRENEETPGGVYTSNNKGKKMLRRNTELLAKLQLTTNKPYLDFDTDSEGSSSPAGNYATAPTTPGSTSDGVWAASPIIGFRLGGHRRRASLPTLSPRLSGASSPKITDFQLIKPISRGAFGAVYLVKKKSNSVQTFYAMKVLKKSEMVARNQVTNVRAERLLLMQAQENNPHVVTLYYSFQSKNFLYFVMEYLPGGDCAALLKNMGTLPEDMARQYIAEMILAVEFLHKKGIIHR
jgi:serine/threonine protein kinase